MLNFGLADLRLVEPQCNHLSGREKERERVWVRVATVQSPQS